MNIAIIEYPGSNCINETVDYFNFINNFVFRIWHKVDDLSIIDNIDLLVIPGGFAFGDRLYNKATENYIINPGIMALNSPVNKIILEVYKKNIPILGICNGFQILTHLGLLPGKLILNKNKKFICKKTKCHLNIDSYNSIHELYIANSYGNYIEDSNINDNYTYFLKYEDNEVAGIYDNTKKIIGMMPHPERNNIDFKFILFKMLLNKKNINSQLLFDKNIKELMFSEHISYKTTRKYLKNLHTKEDWVVQGPGENAGIVDIGKDKNGVEYCIAIRIESHNHPTYINPFEGAATGVGGILRDIFTMGAKPIGILDFLRFGTDNKSKVLLDKAIDGISYYSNCIGVPNLGGDLYLHSSYNFNPIVNIGCLGLVKKNNIVYGNVLSQNNLLIYVGSKTGNEGINGAKMASNIFDNHQNLSDLEKNIQKSDPFLEKLLLDACNEISDLNIIDGMQDMGAGGLLCASIEVIKRGREKTKLNFGANIYLDKVPLKYQMEYINILISESQERMLIVANKNNIDKIFNIFNKWDLEYSIIGDINNNSKYNVFYNNDLLYSENINNFNDINDYTNIPNKIYSKENIWIHKPIKQSNSYHSLIDKFSIYDSTVGNRTIKGPDKNGSYSILYIKEVDKYLFLTWGNDFNHCYNKMLLFENVKPLCIVNCLNYGDPKYCLYDLKNMIDDLSNKCKLYKIPIVGGNVSLYNTTNNNSIYPTPILLMLGIN